MILNEQQQLVINEFKKFWSDPNQQIFQYAGYPGTGKTFLLYEILKSVNIDKKRVAPMAYIGQAAINMRLNGLVNAKTIHSWIYNYEQVFIRDTDGNIKLDPYFNTPLTKNSFVYNPYAMDDYDLIIIDEGGSVPLSLKDDILRYGKKIIVTGDLGQLPPPCDNPAFLTSGKIFKLTQIMRQDDNENNGILILAEKAKNKEKINVGKYGDNCIVILESELSDSMLAEADIVICGTNKTRDKYNRIIRERIKGIRSPLPIHGDILVSRQNNWLIEDNGINLANGLRGYISSYPDISDFDGRRYTIDFKPDRIDNCEFKNISSDYEYLTSNYQIRNKMKNLTYSNGHKFEYGYVISTHMAQGAQYDKGIYIAEWFGDLTHKLHFTGITRFKKELIFVIKGK